MRFSENGLNKLKSLERLKLVAYKDQAGILTIGYGHTGADVKEGDTVTEEQATALLAKDAGIAIWAVNRYITAPLTQNQFDALVIFTFNAGAGALQRSTIRMKLNRRDYTGAAEAFLLYNKISVLVNGVKVKIQSKGLTVRRKFEQRLFLC